MDNQEFGYQPINAIVHCLFGHTRHPELSSLDLGSRSLLAHRSVVSEIMLSKSESAVFKLNSPFL